MELESVQYVFAAYAVTLLTLLVWFAMMSIKLRRLERDRSASQG